MGLNVLKKKEQAVGGWQCREEGPWEPLTLAHCAVEEQLRPGMPQQIFAAQVHVCCKVKLVGWLGILPSCG
jgi:hypothetical protein